MAASLSLRTSRNRDRAPSGSLCSSPSLPNCLARVSCSTSTRRVATTTPGRATFVSTSTTTSRLSLCSTRRPGAFRAGHTRFVMTAIFSRYPVIRARRPKVRSSVAPMPTRPGSRRTSTSRGPISPVSPTGPTGHAGPRPFVRHSRHSRSRSKLRRADSVSSRRATSRGGDAASLSRRSFARSELTAAGAQRHDRWARVVAEHAPPRKSAAGRRARRGALFRWRRRRWRRAHRLRGSRLQVQREVPAR